MNVNTFHIFIVHSFILSVNIVVCLSTKLSVCQHTIVVCLSLGVCLTHLHLQLQKCKYQSLLQSQPHKEYYWQKGPGTEEQNVSKK
jgi:hypothetical protein